MLIEEKYQKERRKKILQLFSVIAVVVVVASICLTLGTEVSFTEGIRAVFDYAVGRPFPEETRIVDNVIVLLRLPRICLAILAGMGLSVAGMMMQAVTRNVLVSPFTLGVASAAAFGASVCIVFGSATVLFNDLYIVGSAFLASMISILIVFTASGYLGITANTVILIGIALNYFFSAMTASLQFFAKENKLAAVVQWTFGTFNKADWHTIAMVGIVLVVCFIICSRLTLKWNAMASGDDELAKSLGLSPQYIRGITMIISVIITATVISFTGVIGFVGLIAPHMARFIIGNDHVFLLPMSAALGAALLVLADTVGKFILYPVDIPVGIVVSFIGVPLFINLIVSTRKRGLR